MNISDFEGTWEVTDVYVIPTDEFRNYYPVEGDQLTIEGSEGTMKEPRELKLTNVKFVAAGDCAVSDVITSTSDNIKAILVLHKHKEDEITGTFLWLKNGMVVQSGIWNGCSK